MGVNINKPILFQWFISNYLYRLSLVHTRASVAAVCVSTVSALAPALGAACAHSAADRLTVVRAAAALLTTAALVSLGTPLMPVLH